MSVLLILTMFSMNLFANVLKLSPEGDFVLTKSQFKVSELVTDYAHLKGYNLNLDQEFKDKDFTVQGQLFIKKGRIENYVTYLLSQSNNAMIKHKDSRFLNVIPAKDVRYSAVPVYKTYEEIPANDNQAQLTFSLKYLEASEASRNMRPFLGRYGRIIGVKSSNTIHIADTGNNIKRMGEILLHMDTPQYLQDKKQSEEINEKHKKSVTPTKNLYEILTSNQVIFIFIFFLMGLIIGFGCRGFMMKKIEGGW